MSSTFESTSDLPTRAAPQGVLRPVKRRPIGPGATLISLAALTGALCVLAAGVQRAAAAGNGDVTVAVGVQAFTSIDPQVEASPPTDAITRLLYQTLVAPGAGNTIKPMLATSWKQVNPRAWNFTLRSGVKFQDGTALTPAAVVATFGRLLDPKNTTLTRASEYTDISKVRAVGSRTVQFDLKSPWPAILNNLAYIGAAIISPQGITQYGTTQLGLHPDGTGPYSLASYNAAGPVVLTANTDYWGGKPGAQKITFVTAPSDPSRLAELESGQAQIALNLETTQLEAVSKSPGLHVISSPGDLLMQVGFNLTYKPLSSRLVRQALNYAINKPAIIKSILRGQAIQAHSYLSQITSGYVNAGTYEYNPAKARQLLKQAGYPHGFSATMLVPTGRYTDAAQVAQAVQGYFSAVGVHVKLQQQDFNTVLTEITTPKKRNKTQMYLLGWEANTGEPSVVSQIVFTSSNYPPTGWNTMFYKNTKVDSLVKKALVAANEAAANRLYAKVQRIVWKDAPWAFLYTGSETVAAKKSLRGIAILPDGTLILQNLRTG